jgi:signal transduction histidine kinase
MAHRMRPLSTVIEGSDGRIWFDGNLGIGWLDPADIRGSLAPSPALIRSVTATGRTYSPREPLSLAPGTRDLQVDYTAVSLSRPDRVRFRYQLQGFDQGWVDAGPRRQAFYTNLRPGLYRFRVAAADEGRHWNETTAPIRITIPPTFLQGRSFALLCIATVIALLWLAYTARIRQLTAGLRSRLEERVAERERIARELHDTLLQGVQGLILMFQTATEEIPPDNPARKLMEEALDRADNVLIEGRDRVKDLRLPPVSNPDLAAVVSEIGAKLAHEESNRFKLSVDGTPRPLEPIVRDELLRIAKEGLTNAFRHAHARMIEAEIIYRRWDLRLRVRDDGCGIDPMILKQGRPDHWGLLGMRERARRIHAAFDVWSRVGSGTEIELRVPARIAYRRCGRHLRWWPAGPWRAEG